MNTKYRLYHPKWHRSRMPIFWWLGKFSFTKFIARELTSLAVAYSVVLLLVQVSIMSRGDELYERFGEWLRNPMVLTFHVLVFIVLLFHTITWLNLAPKALVLHLGKRRIPDRAVLAAHYMAWLAASAVVAWLLIGS